MCSHQAIVYQDKQKVSDSSPIYQDRRKQSLYQELEYRDSKLVSMYKSCYGQVEHIFTYTHSKAHTSL